MIEIRIHGLGGQGVVTMTEILALAGYRSGREAQSFPVFGPERTGAPVTGFIRLDDQPIRVRSQIYEPDIIVVTDDKLLAKIDVAQGAKPNTRLIIASAVPCSELAQKIKLKTKHIICFNAGAIVADRRLANSALLGFVAKTMKLASLADCRRAVKEKLKDKDAQIIKANIEAVTKGYAGK
jgi:pyruvate ferredoxin oxidoreductase gamma subunit/2-oxoisovalerate ferredoxin oxidoreductase gamma subunit